MNRIPINLFVITIAAILSLQFAVENTFADVTGYTEPARTVEVAAAEPGRIAVLLVKEGDIVEKGDLLARLDSDIQELQVKLAEAISNSKGELKRAISELQSKEMIYRHFKELENDGFAQPKELLRAKLELESAEAAVLSRREKMAEASIRLELARSQLKKREVRAPVGGQISEIKSQVGEFVSLTNSGVVTIIQANPIHAKFQVPIPFLGKFPKDASVNVRIGSRVVIGKVERIGLSATSETVPVFVTMPNEDGGIKLGQKCILMGPAKTSLTNR